MDITDFNQLVSDEGLAMSEEDITDELKSEQKKDNNRKLRDIAKLEMKMINPVREDILRYLKNK